MGCRTVIRFPAEATLICFFITEVQVGLEAHSAFLSNVNLGEYSPEREIGLALSLVWL
jgi:hypothetical protein